MTDALGGLELLTKTALSFAKNLIQSGENVIGCIRATGESEDRAFIALDTRLLYIDPILKQSHSIEYLDIQTIEAKDETIFFSRWSKLVVNTSYRGDASTVDILINPSHRRYAMKFAEVVRTKMHEAKTPYSKLEKLEKSPTAFIDELERLVALRNQDGITQEEFEAAKRKLLS